MALTVKKNSRFFVNKKEVTFWLRAEGILGILGILGIWFCRYKWFGLAAAAAGQEIILGILGILGIYSCP